MAINFLNTVNLNKNQLTQAAIESQPNDAAVGATPVAGQIYFNTVSNNLRIYTGATWEEVGGGVESIVWNNGTYVSITTTGTAANPIYQPDLSAIDGTSNLNTRFLSKDNTWDVPAFDNYSSWTLDGDSGSPQGIASGNTALFTGGTKITTAVSATDTLTISHNTTTRTDTTSTVTSNTFGVVNSVATDATGHVTAVDIKTVTVPDNNTTYDLTTAPTGTAVRLTAANPSDDDDVTISGTTGQTAMSRISGTELRVALTDSVTIIDDLTIGGEFVSTGTGQNSFAGQVTVPLVPVADGDAASKRYVDQSNIGQSVFQGGYDAATNTPDLDVSPATDIKKGFFWAVTVGGTFFSEVVQPGDLIYADTDNPGATFSNWVVVQTGQDIATDNTQALAIRGISAYDSTYFNVDATGWATLRPQANANGAKIALTGGVDSGGETTFTVDITALFGTGALAADCIATVKETASSLIVYPKVTGNGTGSLDFKFIPVVSTSAGFYTAYITHI